MVIARPTKMVHIPNIDLIRAPYEESIICAVIYECMHAA